LRWPSQPSRSRTICTATLSDSSMWTLLPQLRQRVHRKRIVSWLETNEAAGASD
jgi:hypothetical protein